VLQWYLQAKFLTGGSFIFRSFFFNIYAPAHLRKFIVFIIVAYSSLEKGQPYIFRVGSGQVLE
jgi:hypothetical protein